MLISVKSVAATTYDRIRHDIIFGKLRPGTKLKLNPLRVNYGVSVTTLREILNRLVSDGFVRAEEQRGFFVSSVSKDDLIEISQLRILLECSALEASIKNGTEDWEASLVAAHHKLSLSEKKMLNEDDEGKENRKQNDREFHLATIKACNSQNLLSSHSTVYFKYLRYQMLILTNRGQIAAHEHKVILDACLKRDTQMAKQELEKHILLGLEHCLDAFKVEL